MDATTNAGPTREERLRQLRRVVEAAPDELFDMSDWSFYRGCSTAHCAAGWASVDPWFRENTEIGDVFDKRGMYSGPIAEKNLGEKSLMTVFLIDYDEAWTLFFDADRDVPKREVLANIDRLLAGEEPEPYTVSDEDDDEDDD